MPTDGWMADRFVQPEVDLALSAVSGLVRRPVSKWADGPSYFVGSREVAHWHKDGSLDIRLTSDVIRELKRASELDGRVRTRGPAAHWVKFPVQDASVAPLAVSLAELAVRANQL